MVRARLWFFNSVVVEFHQHADCRSVRSWIAPTSDGNHHFELCVCCWISTAYGRHQALSTYCPHQDRFDLLRLTRWHRSNSLWRRWYCPQVLHQVVPDTLSRRHPVNQRSAFEEKCRNGRLDCLSAADHFDWLISSAPRSTSLTDCEPRLSDHTSGYRPQPTNLNSSASPPRGRRLIWRHHWRHSTHSSRSRKCHGGPTRRFVVADIRSLYIGSRLPRRVWPYRAWWWWRLPLWWPLSSTNELDLVRHGRRLTVDMLTVNVGSRRIQTRRLEASLLRAMPADKVCHRCYNDGAERHASFRRALMMILYLHSKRAPHRCIQVLSALRSFRSMNDNSCLLSPSTSCHLPSNTWLNRLHAAVAGARASCWRRSLEQTIARATAFSGQ